MLKLMALMAILLGGLLFAGRAMAQSATVQCQSEGYQYNECYAPMRMPVLVQQLSKSACIPNRTWGFNPATLRIWVSDGCGGVFADDAPYYGGQGYPYYGPDYNPPPPRHDHGNHQVEAVVAGAILGAVIESSMHDHKHHKYQSGYNGCHGVGCMVDDPDHRH